MSRKRLPRQPFNSYENVKPMKTMQPSRNPKAVKDSPKSKQVTASAKKIPERVKMVCQLNI